MLSSFSTSSASALAGFLAIQALLIPSTLAARSRYNANGVDAWCDFTWDGGQKVKNVQCGVEDTSCPSNSVTAELYLYCNNAASCLEKKLGKFTNSQGCGHRDWDDTKHSWDTLGANNIFKARVKTCIDGPGRCYDGNLVDNPNA